ETGTAAEKAPTEAAPQEAADPGSVEVAKKRRVRGDVYEGSHTEVTFSDGTTARIQRMSSETTMGLPGWHDMDAKEHSYLADTEADAIKVLTERKAAAAPQSEQQGRGRPGYDTPVKVDARALKGILEESRGEPLA